MQWKVCSSPRVLWHVLVTIQSILTGSIILWPSSSSLIRSNVCSKQLMDLRYIVSFVLFSSRIHKFPLHKEWLWLPLQTTHVCCPFANPLAIFSNTSYQLRGHNQFKWKSNRWTTCCYTFHLIFYIVFTSFAYWWIHSLQSETVFY